MNRIICFAVVVVLTVFQHVVGQNLEKNPKLKNAVVSYLVIDAKSGAELMAFQPEQFMAPASVMKIVPTASALEKFGSDACFETRLVYSGVIKDGVLNGDLYIVGGGDPALGSLRYQDHYYKPVSFLQSWVNVVKKRGIRRVNGNVYAVERENLIAKVPRTWIWEDVANHFGASPGMLNIYDNLYQLHFDTGDGAGKLTELKRVYPNGLGLTFENRVLAAEGGGDQAYVFGAPDSDTRLVSGTLPVGYANFVVKGSIPNPAALAARHYYEHLVAAGVPVSGVFGVKTMPEEYELLDRLESPALAELVRMTNHKSINLYANMIGAMFSPDFSLIEAGEKILEFWESNGMNTEGLYMEDLCGLSPFDQISARQIAFILSYMYGSESRDVFMESLPVSGESGTLRYFGHNKHYHGKFHGKSGSIKRVYCYAGYMEADSGKNLIIVAMVNKFSCTSREAKDALSDFFDSVYLAN